VIYKILYSKQAEKDAKKLKAAGLKESTTGLLKIVEEDPWRNYPRYEKLLGDLLGCYSRRINVKHRLVYEVFEEQKIVRVLRMWTHYGDN
jgi:Txe/YoeB family toxin of toxin-antitoxin system